MNVVGEDLHLTLAAHETCQESSQRHFLPLHPLPSTSRPYASNSRIILLSSFILRTADDSRAWTIFELCTADHCADVLRVKDVLLHSIVREITTERSMQTKHSWSALHRLWLTAW